jgi:hypothetical protein
MPSISPNDPFVAPARVSRDGFRWLLLERAEPAVTAERDAGEYWDAIVSFGVDPLFVAAMFNHESQMGKEGIARTTHSWGNTRNPTFGAESVGETAPGDARSGTFPIFRHWLDGCRSTAARLVEPTWVYHRRSSIREIFDWPPDQTKVWAPAGDFNSPSSYLRSVVDFMRTFADGGPPTGFTPPPIEVDLLPQHLRNRPGTSMVPKGVVIHDTGNPARGADARMHKGYLRGGAVNVPASWHYTVDDTRIVQNLPDLEQGFHASDGGGPGNTTRVAIELCVAEDCDFDNVMRNGAWLTASILRRHGLPCSESTIGQHHDFARDRKNCPRKIRDGRRWSHFLRMVEEFYDDEPVLDPNRHYFPETGKSIILGFKHFWETHGGLEIFGYPLTEEIQEDGRTVQYFERAVFEWWPENPHPFTILLRRLGAEALERTQVQGGDAPPGG